jgi:glycosyltransferase involved in cell wall biosynthesis
MKPGFIIPVYNHGITLDAVTGSLAGYGYPIIIVDDGNDEKNRLLIEAVIRRYSQTVLVTRAKNGGKGAAMRDGMIKAHELGLTHAFQIDSDGQHDAGRVPFFLAESDKHPQAVICGYPEYDASVPRIRKNAREISNRWTRFLSVSGEIKDAMCGFRVYPVEPYYTLIKKHAVIDSRMGCDADILVHLVWAGVRIISYPVKVSYPADGVSNFHMFRDNVHISCTFARLFFGMIVRLPVLVYRAVQRRKTSV